MAVMIAGAGAGAARGAQGADAKTRSKGLIPDQIALALRRCALGPVLSCFGLTATSKKKRKKNRGLSLF